MNEDDAMGELIDLAQRRDRDAPEEGAPIPEHLTELGFARRIVRLHGRDLRYVHPWRRWLVWAPGRWAEDATAEAWRRAKLTVQSIYREAAAARNDTTRKAIAQFATRCEAARKIAAALELAASEPSIPVLHDQLDVDPWLLTVANGTLDLRTGKLMPHRREDLITRMAPVTYDADAICPRWNEFLVEVLPDAEVRDFLQRYAGYSLTGSTREQVLLVLWGGGANGKSTLLEVLRSLLGDYAQHAPTDTIMSKRDTGIPNDVARLRGARLVTIVETEDGRRLAEERIKQFTGGDTVSARYMRAEWFEFRPICKFWLASNHRPAIRGTDYAIWRRIRLVPFTVQIAEADRDPELPAQLRKELPGILAWAMRGCIAWQRAGLSAPDSVLAATAEYQQHEDVLGTWIAERCVLLPQCRAEAGALYADYRTWSEQSGEQPVTQRAFGDRLSERGHAVHRGTAGRKYRTGIGLPAPQTERGSEQ